MLSQTTSEEATKRDAAAATALILKGMAHRARGGPLNMPPGIAQRILDELNFPEQRKRKLYRMRKHLLRIQRGAWRSSFCITFAVSRDGRIWLVDGQHRLWAIVEHDAPVPVRIVFDEVADEREARRLYAFFDEMDSVRNSTEVLDALGVSETMGVKRITAQRLYRALPLLMNNFEAVRGGTASNDAGDVKLQDLRMAEIGNWQLEAVKYERICATADPYIQKKLMGAGCMAVALYTLKHQPARAIEFWTGVAANDGLRKGDPRSRLIADMQERALSVGSVRQSVQQPSIAWNAWNEGRELKIIKCLNGAAISIWGTPMAKRAK